MKVNKDGLSGDPMFNNKVTKRSGDLSGVQPGTHWPLEV